MDSGDDKVIAIIGLLAACLIGVTFLVTMVWLTDIRHPVDPSLDVHTCTPKQHRIQHA
ncbi:hypothetical protein [Pantoea sp.]|uniref:hypothetical protein n=1 Tax=Pantoea sp. TaxID=69393 RepID=UPI0028B120F8|nr:hypothetical protein [Pantoea sp.]